MLSEQFEAVDFAAVLDQFASRAYSAKTAEKIRSARPSTNLMQIRLDLDRADEAAKYLQAGGGLSLGGFTDITRLVLAAKKGMSLLPSELLEVSFSLVPVQPRLMPLIRKPIHFYMKWLQP